MALCGVNALASNMALVHAMRYFCTLWKNWMSTIDCNISFFVVGCLSGCPIWSRLDEHSFLRLHWAWLANVHFCLSFETMFELVCKMTHLGSHIQQLRQLLICYGISGSLLVHCTMTRNFREEKKNNGQHTRQDNRGSSGAHHMHCVLVFVLHTLWEFWAVHIVVAQGIRNSCLALHSQLPILWVTGTQIH